MLFKERAEDQKSREAAAEKWRREDKEGQEVKSRN
jgi:hypothetical protein